jgi:hypothetical protein
VPASVRKAVREAISSYTLGEIDTMFEAEGFSLPPGFVPTQGSMRKSAVDAYVSTIDFTDADDAEAYLGVVDRLFDELSHTQRRTGHPWATEAAERIERELNRASIDRDERGRYRLVRRIATSRSLAAAPTESGIRLAITRLERSDAEPEENVGAAKELVEATLKYALVELGEAFEPGADVPALAKQLHQRLRLDPRGVAPTTRGAGTMVRLLGGLTQIPQGLVELRNEGYGTGHGQATRIAGLKGRHADLAARVAVAYATFIVDTLADPDAPWRQARADPTPA